MTGRAALGGSVLALALVSAIVFAGVAVHELSYAAAHPFRYGPAKVIASSVAAGVALSLAIAMIGYALMRPARDSSR